MRSNLKIFAAVVSRWALMLRAQPASEPCLLSNLASANSHSLGGLPGLTVDWCKRRAKSEP